MGRYLKRYLWWFLGFAGIVVAGAIFLPPSPERRAREEARYQQHLSAVCTGDWVVTLVEYQTRVDATPDRRSLNLKLENMAWRDVGTQPHFVNALIAEKDLLFKVARSLHLDQHVKLERIKLRSTSAFYDEGYGQVEVGISMAGLVSQEGGK